MIDKAKDAILWIDNEGQLCELGSDNTIRKLGEFIELPGDVEGRCWECGHLPCDCA